MALVYIAARGQDQRQARALRDTLAQYGITSTAKWIDQSLDNESHAEAQQDMDDVRAADVLVLIKPAEAHRFTTGGHHVETGIALERGMPVLLLGMIENVFHHHSLVAVLPYPTLSSDYYAVAQSVYALLIARRKRADALTGGSLT